MPKDNSICPTTGLPKDRITVDIKDNGIGMSKDFQQHLFDPSTQEYHQGETERHGTGLGLAIVKRDVEMLGGTISVDSE